MEQYFKNLSFSVFDGESDAELTDKNDPQCLTMKNGKIANFNMVGYDQTFVIQNRRRFVKLPVKEVNFSLFPPEGTVYCLALLVWQNLQKCEKYIFM